MFFALISYQILFRFTCVTGWNGKLMVKNAAFKGEPTYKTRFEAVKAIKESARCVHRE